MIKQIILQEIENRILTQDVDNSFPHDFSEFTSNELETINSFKVLMESKYQEKLSSKKYMVRSIKIKNGSFSIEGDVKDSVLQVISELENADKAVYEAFDNFILEFTGSRISTLSSKVNTGVVTINGVTYDGLSEITYTALVEASNNTLKNATLLAIKLFNTQE